VIDIEVYVVHSQKFQAMVDLLHDGLTEMKKTLGATAIPSYFAYFFRTWPRYRSVFPCG